MPTHEIGRLLLVAAVVVAAAGCQRIAQRDGGEGLVAGAARPVPTAVRPPQGISTPLPTLIASPGLAQNASPELVTMEMLAAESGFDCFRAGDFSINSQYRTDVIERARLLTTSETWVDSGPEWGEPRAGWLGSVTGLATAAGGRIGGIDDSTVWTIHDTDDGQFEGVPSGTPFAREYVRIDVDGRPLWFKTTRILVPQPCDPALEPYPVLPTPSFHIATPTPILCEIVTDSCEPPKPQP